MKYATSLFIAFTVVACKPAPSTNSTTQGLENLVGTDVQNKCAGNFALASGVEGKLASDLPQGYIASAKRSLSAVPTDLQDLFFNQFDGHIELARDLKTACGLDSNSDAMSCYKLNSDQTITIYLKDRGNAVSNLEVVNGEIVRQFGFVVSEVVAKMRLEGDELAFSDNADFDVLKKDLSSRFLADVRANYKNVSLDANSASFHDEVYAEMFDSAFCSAESQASLQKNFPSSHELVSDFKSMLLDALNPSTAVNIANASDSVSSTSSLNLARRGRFVRGQPLRNAARAVGGGARWAGRKIANGGRAIHNGWVNLQQRRQAAGRPQWVRTLRHRPLR